MGEPWWVLLEMGSLPRPIVVEADARVVRWVVALSRSRCSSHKLAEVWHVDGEEGRRFCAARPKGALVHVVQLRLWPAKQSSELRKPPYGCGPIVVVDARVLHRKRDAKAQALGGEEKRSP